MVSEPISGHQLLDLLVDGPSSFAGLYSAANRLLREDTSEPFSVDGLWDALASMEAAGWIKARLVLPAGTWTDPTDRDRERARRQYQNWLPRAAYEEMSIDEVGIWFELQPLGRGEWAKWSEATDVSPKWVLDQDSGTSTITVHAASPEQAEQVVGEWLAQHPDLELVGGTRVTGPSAGYRLRDGTHVRGGLTLRVTYRERPSGPGA